MNDDETEDQYKLTHRACDLCPDIHADRISVWPFDKAPKKLQEACSLNGGDEDWIVAVPPDIALDWTPHWIECMDSCNEPDEYTTADRWTIYVGSHA